MRTIKIGFVLFCIPPECTTMYFPFIERYYYQILYGSLFAGLVLVATFLLLSGGLVIERRRKREAQRNLQYEHETLALAIEGAATYAWRIDKNGIAFDSQFKELIGHAHTHKHIAIGDILEFVHPDDREAFRGNFAQIQHRLHNKGEYRCNFTGRYQWWEFRYNTIRNMDNRLVITGLLQNIQDVKDRESELIQARKLAENAELKQSFLNNMSHEIRTPLNAIAGFSGMLVGDSESTDEEKAEYVDIINLNTNLLLKLVDDVLDLARIESEPLSSGSAKESVRTLLDRVYHTQRRLIQPPLAFLKNFPDEDVSVNIDPMRLTQVLINFLNNADKFTTEGSVTLGYNVVQQTREVCIYVEDSGIGIAEDEQKMIFQRFYKHNQFSQGVGLGLSICQLIAEKLGGRIEVQSQVGRGSRFTIVLPCAD